MEYRIYDIEYDALLNFKEPTNSLIRMEPHVHTQQIRFCCCALCQQSPICTHTKHQIAWVHYFPKGPIYAHTTHSTPLLRFMSHEAQQVWHEAQQRREAQQRSRMCCRAPCWNVLLGFMRFISSCLRFCASGRWTRRVLCAHTSHGRFQWRTILQKPHVHTHNRSDSVAVLNVTRVLCAHSHTSKS